MKKIMIIPLVICIILALPLSVYAATIDDVVENIGYTTHFYLLDLTYYESGPYRATSPIGYQPHTIIFDNMGWSSSDMTYYLDVYTEISISSESDIYLCFPHSYVSSYTSKYFIPIDGVTLDLYHNPVGDFVATQVSYDTGVNVDYNNATAYTFTQNTGGSYDWIYFKFEDVPAGTYKFRSVYPNFLSYDGSMVFPSTPFGFFVNDKYADFDYFDLWYSQDDPLEVQIDSINEVLQRGLDSATNIDYEHFYTTFATYQLQSVIAQAEFKDIDVVNGFSDTVSGIVTDFAISGSVDDFVDSLTALSSAYTDVLSDCQTIEGGKYASGIYQARQQQLLIHAQLKAGEKLDSAISNDELQRADDYYAAEDEILSHFDLQQMTDLISYQQWLNLLEIDDAYQYRSIFNWFIDDSAFALFIVVPISLTLVAIILGTAITFGGRSHD